MAISLRRLLGATTLSLIVPACIFALWILISVAQLASAYIIPSPLGVAAAAYKMVTSGLLAKSLAWSMFRLTIATLTAVLIALPLGIAMGTVEVLRHLFDPLLKFRYLPVYALFPLIIFLAGVDEESKIIFLFVSIFAYLLPGVVDAVDAVPSEFVEGTKTLGFTDWQIVRHIVIPAALPEISRTFLIINAIGWNTLIVAEIINARHGLGHTLLMASNRGQMDMILASLLVIYAIAFALDWSVKLFIFKSFTWKGRRWHGLR